MSKYNVCYDSSFLLFADIKYIDNASTLCLIDEPGGSKIIL